MKRKIFAILMVFLLVITSIDLSNFNGSGIVSAEQKTTKSPKLPKKIEKIRELEDLREPNSKTFINTDGTYTKEIYTEDIHYKDKEKNKYKNISNTPEVNSGSDKGDFKFKNKDNKFGVKFAINTKKKSLISLDFENEKLNFQAVDAKHSSAKQEVGSIIYEGIYNGVDFKYSLGSSSVKEDIILNTRESERKFQFLLTGSLLPKKEDGNINFYNKKGALIWTMPRPFMEDQNGNYSEDIVFDLKEEKNGYLLTLIPDAKYLDDKDTEYPVRIDPTANLGGTNATTLDTYVMSAYSGTNYYNSADLRIGYTSSTGVNRSYINFTNALPNLAGKILVKAELKVYKWADIGTPISANVYANRVTSSWGINTVTYGNQPSLDTATAYGSTSATGAAGWKTLNVTGLVDGWLKKKYPNYGLVIRSTSEGTAGTYQKFNASESSSNRPYLAITYSERPGQPTLSADSYMNSTGYINVNWSPVSGATKYKVLIYNGVAYEEFDVGNVTSWSTKGRKIWPTKAQIDSQQYGLRKSGDGRELPENPNYLYAKAPGSTYLSNTNYAIRVKAVNNYGETSHSDAAVITIPDKTKPKEPGAVRISNDRVDQYTVDWQAATDPDGTGIVKYKVYLGEQPGVANLVSGAETTHTILNYTYSGTLVAGKTYYAWVQAVDKAGNISLNSATASSVAKKDYDAQIINTDIPQVSDVDNTAGEKLQFTVVNKGKAAWTNDQNINLTVASTAPGDKDPTAFVGYLQPGEVIPPGGTKVFTVNWMAKKATKGTYQIIATVGHGNKIEPLDSVKHHIEVKDLVPPTGKVLINEGKPYTTSQDITISAFDVFDNTTGDLYVEFAEGPANATVDKLKFLPKELILQSPHVKAWKLPDMKGEHTIYAKFSDSSGNVSGLYSDSIILDKDVPDIKVSNVATGDYISGVKKIEGTITDENLLSYKVEYRNKNDQSINWHLVTEKNGQMADGILAEWDTSSLPKGEYELLITASDAANRNNYYQVSVWIDTHDKNWTGLEGYYPLYPISLRDGSGSVNLYNGSLNLQDVDFSLPSRAFDLLIGRTYSSNAIQEGMLGKGWMSNLEERINNKGDRVEYRDGDGTVHAFIRKPDGSFVTPLGTPYHLTFSSTTGYELSQKSGDLTVKKFDLEGKLVSIKDNNGNSIQYSYENGKLTKVTTLNKSVSLQYNPEGLLDNAVFSTGEKVSYSYSGQNLKEATLHTKSGKLSGRTMYEYENELLTAVVSKNGLKVEFSYNGNRLVQTKTIRTTRIVDIGQYPLKTSNVVENFLYNLSNQTIDIAAQSVNEEEKSKNLSNYEFKLSQDGNLAQQTIVRTPVDNESLEDAKRDENNITVKTKFQKNRVESITDGKGYITSYEYDEYGNLLKVHLPPVKVNGVLTNYSTSNTYNSNGQRTKAVNTMGQSKEWKYDSKGNVFQVIDEVGNSQYIQYDSYGNVRETKSDRGPLYGYIPDYSMEEKTLEKWTIQGTATKSTSQAKSGKQSIEMAPNAVLLTGSFPIKKGRLPVLALVQAIAPAGSANVEMKVQYLKDGAVTKEFAQSSVLSTKWAEYRVSGEVPTDATHVRIQLANKGTGNLFVDDLVLEESGIKTTYTYDESGENLKEVIDPYGNKTTYSYNVYNQVLTETNALNQTEKNEYDEEQRLKKKTDRTGRVTSYEYDPLSDNLLKEINGLGNVTAYEYNEWDQLLLTAFPKVEVITYNDEEIDRSEVQQAKVYIQYDELGRKIKENDENGKAYSTVEYDGWGRVAKSIDPMKNQKYFDYDANGNIIHTIDYAAKSTPDGKDTLLINNGEMFASFDEWNRQIDETDNTGNRNVLTMVNTYDSENRLIQTKDAEGTQVFYTFNALNENVYTRDNSTPPVETWTYYDSFGTPSITLTGSTVEYSVSDANGNILELVDHKGTRTKYEYNTVGDKIKQTNPDGTLTVWTYNDDGQIKTESQLVEDKGDIETYLVSEFTYNNVAEVKNQKLEVHKINKTTKATDKQILRETDLTHDTMGRLIRELSINHQGEQLKKTDIRFAYDLNGNLLKKWIYDENSTTVIGEETYSFARSVSTYEYDNNNRPIEERKFEGGNLTNRTYTDEDNKETTQSINTKFLGSSAGTTSVYYNENDLAKKVITPLSEEYQFEYLPSELLDKVRGPRLTVDMDYGPNERMTLIKTLKKDTTSALFSEAYTYNGEEQIQTATNPWDGQKSYTYTPEGFLKTVTKGSETTTYSYDVSGNLLKAVNTAGKILLDNQYALGNRISSSIQFDSATQKYKRTNYTFRADGSLSKETISIPVDTYDAAKTATVEFEKEYQFASINVLQGIVTKKGGAVVEKVEFTNDSEDNRISKKVTNAKGERTEYYYYDANSDLIGISEQSGIDPVQNLMNFYRDANGQLLNFEYKGEVYDYIYNQRGDIVAIADRLQSILAKYTYDEWGNLQNIDAPTNLGMEVAKANPFRYVGKFGVQYDNDTKLYFMGWRDYDSKIGRYIVADEYEGEEANPVSFNRYLYAESDPVNNIDPDGYAPKWLKKLSKGVKKGAKATYNFVLGDDIRTLTSKNTKWYQKAGAAVSIASNFIPGGGFVTKAAKVAIKGTSKSVKGYRASKTVAKAAKVVRTTSKKAAGKATIKPKTVNASSIKGTPKIQTPARERAIYPAPEPKPKSTYGQSTKRTPPQTPMERMNSGKGPGQPTKNAVESNKGTGNGYKYWNKTTEFNNVKVYQRDDIIDPSMVDARGRTNVERMKKGLAPLGPDGKSINLHHTTQRNTSSIAEVTQTFHKENSSVIHINPNTIPSGINRTEFKKWRTDYWKNRANDF
ncbi:DNRLRE domain-containing protein [Bacillus sp. B-jedd]|uniref:DNRLRE domain-containing protein n=1 Tax=Bacillus sp. B-jedd TaxID=1476857 RepID=UPI0005155DFB|nr:DNRLRE domain-containing protein [Bacillus sp. B-jedd]CEG25313.1 cell wall-associated protein [Bacillus sp. B-jedd]